ncbi:hypothetical protein Ahy_A03g016317 isoform E [Arachis hypogaea]|uniref:Uncharacterized protein n=1 Tax=Arachis hypogaea TaxID=3818 RepID=A0A445E336_ARAHY|nr:hypothetical protein Ahy_A03g016317 isoform E [Arachis hypogaea]
MRYAGNLESFKVEEQVALTGGFISACKIAAVDLKVVVFVNDLAKFKLDDRCFEDSPGNSPFLQQNCLWASCNWESHLFSPKAYYAFAVMMMLQLEHKEAVGSLWEIKIGEEG